VLRFQRVTETDSAGTKRLVTIEITDQAIFRTSKAEMWEGKLPFAALIGVDIRREGVSDLVTAETKHGQIQWNLKNGKALITAIEQHLN
tara:strand:- start:5429 stop:5695 length:267 start_codon:yes stop_codon:yes gene_type:complete